MEHKTTSLKVGILWNTWGNIYYLFCQWLLTILVVRLANFEMAGELSYAMTISNIFYSISIYGMRNFQVSDIKDKYQNGTYIFSRLLTSGGAIFLSLLLLLVSGYSFEKSLVIFIYVVFKLSETIFDVYSAIFQKKWRVDLIGKSLIIRGTLGTLGFISTLVLTKNLFLAILSMAFITYICIIFFDLYHAKKIDNVAIVFSKDAVKSLLIECLPLAIYFLILAIIGAIPRYFLDLYEGSKQVGIYSSIATPTLIVQTLAIQVFSPFITIFAEKFHEKDKAGFWAIFKKCITVVGLIAIASLVGAFLLGDFALNILYGAKILAYSYLLLPLIFATILTAFSWLLSGILTVIRGFRELIITNIIALFICLVSSYFFIKNFGLQGTNIATILPLLVQVVLLFFLLIKKAKFALK
ncbi:MAG: lipopolysaccharide biosynthesis protein [Fusobacteriaceae bacterium]